MNQFMQRHTVTGNFRRAFIHLKYLSFIVVFLHLFWASGSYAANVYYSLELGKQRTAAYSTVHGLNNMKQAVGHGNQAFLWENGEQKVMTPFSYWSEAVAINDNGVAVGIAARNSSAKNKGVSEK